MPRVRAHASATGSTIDQGYAIAVSESFARPEQAPRTAGKLERVIGVFTGSSKSASRCIG
jgi:hypothetical protein